MYAFYTHACTIINMQRLEMSQSENQKLSAGERKHKADLGKLKNTASAGRLVS